ncbi:hypothetical protein TVAG_093490 [Trichomonas vaginalis G3]|uniref:Sorting nexin/Vps5-like C-terminal domain-containing protein n=1 Tax=Trichomonas vaginalis (strain ATCC PRA-98 / G3) TaxID=412133 RepID=A2DBH2_TRIV3|nr:arfaptin homology (AH) domain/bar domain domain-containing protein [Trichomonas vaginalis G3]EAY22175.1 hypothetical protein TVAG_093490 [Trichomonas vaginalis G3]KAI5533367.1 arfaptin homology (AH) domain/bar domain domain-containing protein [Trichomonas vaginalis G3]|eukprot:XP_001583161.1 hypothetical protein [Trichomonas vaginalis G3]
MSKASDEISRKIEESVVAVRLKADSVRKIMKAANQKGRSVGALSEEFADGVEKAATNQFDAVHASLIGFSTILGRVEFLRKACYQRIDALSQTALVNQSKPAQGLQTSLNKRNEALRILQTQTNVPAADQKAVQTRITAQGANNLAMQEARQWYTQYNVELKRVLREYAHAQMEFAAKALEQWSNFMEDLALLDFNTDTDAIVTKLEQGAALQTGEPAPPTDNEAH